MEGGFQLKLLICSVCNEEFVFTVAAQEYFAERGYTDDPKRCKACHTNFKKTSRSIKSEEIQDEIKYPE